MERCIPLELTQRVADCYPNCWNQIEEFRADKTLNIWDKRCYIPIGGGIAISKHGESGSIIDSTLDAPLICATASWRLHKQIYSFNPVLEKILIDQADEDVKIPIDILNKIPYHSIYVETNTMEEYEGFFVHFEFDPVARELELRFLIVCRDGEIVPVPLHLIENSTVTESTIATFKELRDKYKGKRSVIVDDIEQHSAKLCSRFLQLVLYICSVNKDIIEDPIQKNITKHPSSFQFIKDKYREVQKWRLGENTGKLLAKVYKKQQDEEEAKVSMKAPKPTRHKAGTPKRPHYRKAHWHHYWVGSEAKNTRTLELKWMAPMFIHKDDFNEGAIEEI